MLYCSQSTGKMSIAKVFSVIIFLTRDYEFDYFLMDIILLKPILKSSPIRITVKLDILRSKKRTLANSKVLKLKLLRKPLGSLSMIASLAAM